MENDLIRIMCPNLRCQCVLAVLASTRGLVIRCRKCSTTIRVPLEQDQETPRNLPSPGDSERKAA